MYSLLVVVTVDTGKVESELKIKLLAKIKDVLFLENWTPAR
jgi:hypothetical protein